MLTRKESILLPLAALGASSASAHPGASTAQAEDATLATHFVGEVQGSEAYICILRDGRKIGGYVCNDGPGGQWIPYVWLRNGRATLRSAEGAVIGRVRFDGDVATGTVEVAGRSRRFRASRVRRGDAGLWFSVGLQQNGLLVGGWVFLPDGSQRGAVSGVDTATLEARPTTRAPRLNRRRPVVLGDPEGPAPPVQTEPEQLVVINIIAILIGLLVPAVQK